MTFYHQDLTTEQLNCLKPAAEEYQKRLESLGIVVRNYNNNKAHLNLYVATELLHTELCGYDLTNLNKFFRVYPCIRDLVNHWAHGRGIRTFPKDEQ